MIDKGEASLKSYKTFVLRIWREEATNEKRVLLLDTTTGKRWLFPNFQALSTHFQQKFDNENFSKSERIYLWVRKNDRRD